MELRVAVAESVPKRKGMDLRSLGQQREGFFWMALAVSGYASFSIFTKLIYAHSDMQPLDVASWRFLLATPLVWLYLWLRGRARGVVPLPPQRYLLLLGGIYCLASVLAFFGLRQIPASIYVILFFTYPVMVALLGHFFGTSLRREGWLALLVTSLGVMLVLAPSVDTLQLGNAVLIGMFIALANAGVAAVYFVASNRILYRLQDPSELARAVAWTMLATAAIMLVISIFHGLLLPQNWLQLLLLLGNSVFATALPIVALNIGIQRLGAARSAIIAMLEPFLTLLLASLLLSERLGGLQLLGGMVILLSVSSFEMISLRRAARAATEARATAEAPS